MGSFLVHGIILQHNNFREVDRLLTVYTEEMGKLQVIARGARKISSKMAGSLEPLLEVQMMFVHGRYNNTVTSVEVLNSWQPLKTDVDKVQFANYISMILDRSTRDQQRDGRIFHLYKGTLEAIEKQPFLSQQRSITTWFFVWQLLFYLGHQPELNNCLNCRIKIAAKKNFFTMSKGGVICSSCRSQSRGNVSISNNAIKILRLLISQPRDTLNNIIIGRSIMTELDGLTTSYLNYTQEGDFRINDFLLAV